MPTLANAPSIARELFIGAAGRVRPGGLARRLPQPARERPFIIVTGPGRSGTSAVARVLHESGLRMGRTFDVASEFNPAGFYEELPVCDLNDRIMEDAGMEGTARWPWRSTVLAAARKHTGGMEDLGRRVDVDGWKDPRFCVTLEAWLPHLPSPPKVIVCLRSPEAFVHSVVRIFGLFPREPLERWWTGHLRRLLDVIRDYRLEATAVPYEELIERPAETVAALSSFVGHPLDPGYIEPKLRRFAHRVPRRHAALYEEARALGRPARGRAPTPHGALDGPAVDEYVEAVRRVDAEVRTERDAWIGRLGSPPNPTLDGASEAERDLARAACSAYDEALRHAQEKLAETIPPEPFEEYHDMTAAWIDRERLVARLLLDAAAETPSGDGAVDGALTAWDRFSHPNVEAKERRRREREFRRALQTSGSATHDVQK